jgi:cyclic pyranopterin phosphate synthase
MESESHENVAASLTHVNEAGAAHMVDVSAKPSTPREAEARGRVRMNASTLDLIRTNAASKGDVLGVARIAGIMAAKRTDQLIPLCHSVPLSGLDLELTLDQASSSVAIVATARTVAGTGVEMEALVAVSAAALTIYDMCKAVDRGMTIDEIRVTFKSGGASGTFDRR